MSPSQSTTPEPGSESASAPWKPGRPNILVSGTPGVGKTHISAQVAHELGLRHIEVGAFARERDLLAEHDEEHDAYYMHEDAVLDALEPLLSTGGVVIDHHSCDWFPERWFQLAIVLHARTDVLYDRLTARGYAGTKLDSNMQAEIMQVVAEETVDSYPKLDVMRLQNEDLDQCAANVRKVKRAYQALERPSVNPTDVVH